MKAAFLISMLAGICCSSLGQQLQDVGIAKVVESQRWGVSISVPTGISASEALKTFAMEHGMGEKVSADMAWTVGTVGFTQKEDKKGFFAQRETAYGRASDLASAELTRAFPVWTFDDGAGEKATISASFVILQAEGENPTSGAYEVAVLAVRSKDLDKLLFAVCTGAEVVAAGPVGEPISDWAARTGGNLCGSRLVFDEMGRPWFVGGASRGLKNPQSKNAASLRSRLLAESFARKLALQPVVGKTFENLRLAGLRKLSNGAKKDAFTGSFRYYEVCGVPADGLAIACRQAHDQIVRRRRELEAAARSVAALDDSERPAVVEQVMSAVQTAAHRPSAVEKPIKKPVESTVGKLVEEPSVRKNENSVEIPSELMPAVKHEAAELEEEACSPAEKAIRDLCARQEWCIGWDVANARVIQIGLAEFPCPAAKSRSDKAFFERREDAVRRAFAEAILKISCQLSFNVCVLPADKIAVKVEGATLMTMSEGWNPATGNYQVAVLVTWSKAFEKAARFTLAGKPYAMPLGRDSVRDWIAKLNPSMMVGSRKFIDWKGNCWMIGTTVFRWSDTLLMDERTRRMDRALGFVKEMLALGGYAEIVLNREDYDNLMTEFRSMSKESDINRLLAGIDLSVRTRQNLVRGEKELLDRVVTHPATGERIRVIVYGLTAGLAANAIR